ncbi:MAG: hypothetical protein PHQ63_04910 [Smithellaceae bacterium]|nr:hypothetical protein [Smithellaceae bacterium]
MIEVGDWQREGEDAQDKLEQKAGAAALEFYGNNDKKISPYLKAWIAQPDKESKISVCVVGLIGPGTSRALQANWNSPFEQSTLGGMFEKVGGLLQATTEKTSVTTLSSTQIWEGNRPHTFNLTLSFYAINDAFREVMEPLRELEKMMGPEISAGQEGDGPVMSFLKSATPSGRIPRPVILNIGRRMMIPNCVIESMSVPLDKERDRFGNLIRAEVSLSISTKVMLNRDNIAATWR